MRVTKWNRLKLYITPNATQYPPIYFFLCAEILEMWIWNDKDIWDIELSDEEYKPSRYADEKSFISNESSGSMDSILKELDFTIKKKISGLKIYLIFQNLLWYG